MREVSHRIWSSVSRAVRTTPVEVAIIVLSAIAVSLTVEDVGSMSAEGLATILATAALVGLVSFITSSAHALRVFDSRTRWLLNLCFGAAAVSYGSFVFDPNLMTELWRFGFLTAGGLGLVTLVPLAAKVSKASASERFWRFNVQLGVRVALAGFYATTLFAGICIGIAATEELLGFHVDGDTIGHLAIWIVGALGTTLAVSGLKDAARIDREFSREAKVLGAQLGTWLFLPLMLLYLAIMYVYLAQVVTGAAAPSNVLSPLALGAGLLGYLGLFLLHPVRQLDDYRVLNRALDIFPAAFVPLVGLGLWAVVERVDQYGWTEFRYARIAALVCLGAFSVAGTWKWLRKQEFSLTSGPSIIASVALLSAVGPWGASNVSYQSQLSRLQEKVQEHALVGDDGMLLSAETLRTGDGGKIYSEVKYLLEAHGPESLGNLSPVELDKMQNWERLGALGVDGVSESHRVATVQVDREEPMMTPAGRLYPVNVNQTKRAGTPSSVARFDGPDLLVEVDGVVLSASLGSFAGATYESLVTKPPAEMRRVLVAEDGRRRGVVLVKYLSLEEIDGEWRPTYLDGFIVVE